MSNIPVGEVRPSQLLWTYGPGALIDLPNISVLTMGLDRWDQERCLPVEESRLLEAVRRVLGPQVERLRMPPIKPGEDTTPLDPDARIGVPVRPFPRWLRCVRCGTLAEFDSGLFSIKDNPFRPEDTRFVHKNCEKGNDSDAVPARFLLACRQGHLDDFPWRYYLHEGQGFPDCKGSLRFFEQGASLQTENLWVKCDGCGVPARSLVHAFGREAEKNLPACRGRHPHLNTFDDDCNERPRAVLLGSTNSWFSISLFLVSFVAYYVGSVVDALQRAIERNVQVRVLLEQSKEHGGHVTVDSIAMLKRSLPRGKIYEWNKATADASPTASVHAKCAVADGAIAFVTSANLSDAAMERNMELGVLLRGGQVPGLLDRHLAALVTTKQLRAL